MTSFTATKIRSEKRLGFTLVELLVTVGIIAVLVAILLPVLASARKRATKARIGLDLQNLSQALEAYRQDFKDYPAVDLTAVNPITVLSSTCDRVGAITLCWALLAPGPATTNGTLGGDGADGPGFRVRGTQGQVYGPYIQPDKFNITGTSDWDSTINDVRGNPYLYYRANPVANIKTAGAYAGSYNPTNGGTIPMYNYYENNNLITNGHSFAMEDFQKILGADPTGALLVGGSPATTAPYILWSAGSDELWGYNSSGAGNGPVLTTVDDVTNFNN
jgi:prepilin-type N-terminal cleavage/methylation domain-containing protein